MIDRENGGFHHIVSTLRALAPGCAASTRSPAATIRTGSTGSRRACSPYPAPDAVRVCAATQLMSNHCPHRARVSPARMETPWSIRTRKVARRWLVAYPPRRAEPAGGARRRAHGRIPRADLRAARSARRPVVVHEVPEPRNLRGGPTGRTIAPEIFGEGRFKSSAAPEECSRRSMRAWCTST